MHEGITQLETDSYSIGPTENFSVACGRIARSAIKFDVNVQYWTGAEWTVPKGTTRQQATQLALDTVRQHSGIERYEDPSNENILPIGPSPDVNKLKYQISGAARLTPCVVQLWNGDQWVAPQGLSPDVAEKQYKAMTLGL